MRAATCAIGLILLVSTAGGIGDARPRQQKSADAKQPATLDKSLKTETRLITVDVVVTDSHGNPVRGLKEEDFHILEAHGQEQKVAKFDFVDTAAVSAAAPAAAPAPKPWGSAPIFTNVQTSPMSVPPTAILMDALNTPTGAQAQVRRDMLLFLKKLPADTPVAVLLLGHTVHIVQNFTTDPALLRTAVDHALQPSVIEKNPEDDPQNVSNTLRQSGQAGGSGPGSVPEYIVQRIEDFERETYMEQMQDRVIETADAMKAIAKYLGRYPGRKNLIWFSEAFPIWIEPSVDFGSNPFAGSTQFGDKVKDAADALTNARIAVYPVDARGLEGPAAMGADNENTSTPQQPGGDIGGALRRESAIRINSQATMEEVADETGGKLCENTNDLAGCVETAVHQSSAYYELAYYPESVKWDGHFHKITVKVAQPGAKLLYRRGYFASNTREAMMHDDPLKLLQQACNDGLPATAIPVTAQAVVPAESSAAKSGAARYLLTIPTASLSLPADGSGRKLNLEMAICEFTPKGNSFLFHPQDLSRSVPEAVYASWQTHGFRNIFSYDAKPESQRLRFAVVDVPTGETGALDVPAHPREFASLPGYAATATSAAPSAPPAPPPAAGPAPPGPMAAPASAPGPTGAPPREVMTGLTFRSGTGAASRLDWSKGEVTYGGDLGADVGAAAFFQTFVGGQFHCQAGNLVPRQAGSTEVPRLIFKLPSLTGQAATVDLNGSEPQYSGDLPVDPRAKVFFSQVWKLCHCQQQ